MLRYGTTSTGNLMLGDWVTVRRAKGSPRMTVRVGELTHDFVTSCTGDSFYDCYVEPVALTDTMLSDNGFAYRYIGRTSPREEGTMVEYSAWDMLFFTVIQRLDLESGEIRFFWETPGSHGFVCELNYVHELQHAMKIAQVEKEIKIKDNQQLQ